MKELLKEKAFTLLEILIVITIISILAAFLSPIFQYVKENARYAKDRVAARSLETAFKSYLDVYKVWPTDDEIRMELKGDLFKILQGENQQGIMFYEFDEFSSGQKAAYDAFSDPNWKSVEESGPQYKPEVYQVMFDANYNNQIVLGDQVIARNVIVWSFGKNRENDNGTGDDVCSWK